MHKFQLLLLYYDQSNMVEINDIDTEIAKCKKKSNRIKQSYAAR